MKSIVFTFCAAFILGITVNTFSAEPPKTQTTFVLTPAPKTYSFAPGSKADSCVQHFLKHIEEAIIPACHLHEGNNK